MAEIKSYLQIDDNSMPFSLEAEQAVLGCILLDPSTINLVTTILKDENSFYLPNHQAIFKAMRLLDAKGKPIDALVVLNELKNENIFDDETGKNYLIQLSMLVPSTDNLESYAKIVKEKYYARNLINVGREIVDDTITSDKSSDQLIDDAEQKIYNIRQGKMSSSAVRLSTIITGEVYNHLTLISSDNADEYKGFTTGFGELDDVISGLNKSDLIIVGARPGMGKTSFALNVAVNASSKAKKKVLFFSLEMTKGQLAERILSIESRVESSKMRSGKFDDDDWKRMSEATDILSKLEFYIDDTSNITVPEMKARARRLKDVDLIVIDYLQLMSGTDKKRNENRVLEVSEITRNLKLMAKDLGVPVITLAQLSRSTEARGKSHRPQLSDLRESGSIEQDADIVLMLYRDEYYKNGSTDDEEDNEKVIDPTAISNIEVIVAKNRHGSIRTVNLAWNPNYTLFTNIDNRR